MISVNRQLPALFLATPKQICANSVQESGFKYLENMNRLMWIVPGGYPKDGTLKKKERMKENTRNCAVILKVMMPILDIFSTRLVPFDFTVDNCRSVIIYNQTIQCHPKEDGFPSESSSSQVSFFIVSGSFSLPLRCGFFFLFCYCVYC